MSPKMIKVTTQLTVQQVFKYAAGA